MEGLISSPVEVEATARPEPLATPPAAAGPQFSVLVVAPHELVQYGIRLMLSRQSWSGRYLSAGDIATALRLVERRPPEIAMVDVKLAGESTEDACMALRRVAPGIRRLLLTTSDFIPPRTVASMGADGFISKGWSSSAIAETLELVGAGRTQAASSVRGSALSPRQQEMMQLLADGATNDQIAELLHLSASTVKQHTSAAYRKLGVRNRAAAIARARALALL